MSKLEDFLNKNQIGSEGNPLPYTHSTESYRLEAILNKGQLEATECQFFEEELLYFFKGRPAYKQTSDGEEASYWQLPTCFIYDKLPAESAKRTLPFDSGAFKQGRYPSYIRLMPVEEFEVSGVDAADRLVEAFFVDLEAYLHGDAKSEVELQESYSVSAFDAEVLAIRRLASDGTPKTFDDRRFTIEVQIEESINLYERPPSAVILPLVYMNDKAVQMAFEKWGAVPLTYDVHAQSLELYYGVIFQKYLDYLRDTKVIE